MLMAEDHEMPYYYCSNCLRLSPSIGSILEDNVICLVCGLSMDSEKTGKRVLLSEKEALLRNLLWRNRS